VEPGNINKIQLAPTVQATKSNYSGAHGGSKVPYIEYFLKLRNIEKYNQSEQGFRYLKKYNSNILIKNIKKIKKKENFYWFSKNEIKKLIYKKNMINMDTLSVLSSILKKNNKDNPVNNKLKIVKWLKILDQRFYIKTQIVKLSVLKDWNFNSKNIVHRNKKHFSIIGVDVKASRREVNSWSQPIIQGKKTAFAGFLKSKINDTDHYLCRYIIKPGLKNSVIGCTINTSDISEFNKNNIFNKIEKKFYKEYFTLKKNKANIIFDNILSDEGGRFYQCQVRCMITSVNYKEVKDIPNNYMWLSYNQVNEMIKNKKVDIESRLLFVCNNIDQIQ
jgi:oxidase EvaA